MPTLAALGRLLGLFIVWPLLWLFDLGNALAGSRSFSSGRRESQFHWSRAYSRLRENWPP